MDISKQFDAIVQGIVQDIQSKVNDQIVNTIKSELKTQLDNIDYTAIIGNLAASKLDQKISNIEFDPTAMQKRIAAATNIVVENIESQAKKTIDSVISTKISSTDFNKQLNGAMTTVLSNKIKELHFPDSSIPAKSIKQQDLELTGSQIKGGIITNFGSTGIDDRATECVVTILDTAVVIENNLVTLDLTVQGNLDVKGTIPESSPFFKQLTTKVTKNVQNGLDTELFSGFSSTIFNKIRDEGLDLNKITVNQNSIIEGNRIGYSITESNLQKLGLLKELQVQGETQLAETLYVGNKRAGINTIEPSAAFAVWDEDIEITVSKDRDGQGRIGTPRNQSLVLGSNRNSNLVLSTDGSVQIDTLFVGSVKVTSSENPPRFSSTKGHIVFNANPNVGGPLGWVCLGAANWANFGIID